MAGSKKTLAAIASTMIRSATAPSALALTVAAGSAASAQVTQVEPYYVVVKENNVYLRSGAGVVWYEIGKVNQGQVLRVDGHEFGWLRVGYPSGMAAIVKANEAEYDPSTGEVTLLRESKLQASNPAGGVADSWRQLLDEPLPADTVLQHLETLKNSSGEVTGYRVIAPGGAKGYVSETLVRAATEDEVQRYLAAPAMAAKQPEPQRGQQTNATTPGDRAEPTRAVAAETAETLAEEAADLADAEALPADADEIDTAPVAQRDEPSASRTPQQPVETVNRFPPPAADATQDEAPEAPALSTPMRAGGESSRDLERAPTAPPPASYADLNRAFEEVMRQPTEGAEYGPLIGEFRRLLDTLPDEPGSDAMRAAAQGRVNALRLRADLQEQMQKMSEALAAADKGTQRVQESAETLDSNPVYRFVGRLGSSTVYNGQRLPLLYRVQAVDSGRTIAYLTPDPALDLTAKLGSVVGIVIKQSRDEGSLGLPLVDAKRVDIIKAQSPAR